jgi:integrase
LSEDQVLTLLKAVEGHRFEAAFGLMLLVGLRRGEVLGLRWSDLDLKSTPGTVTVRQALKLSAGRAVLGDVKTASSQRVLPLPAFVADALRAHQEHQASATVRPIGAGPGLVFVSRVGTPCDPSRFYSTFRRVATKALGDPPKNIDGTPGKPWHPHDARHTNTSQLLAQGVPLEVVSKWLGHSSIRITADTYAHLLPGQREQAAASMDNMLAQARAARESSR